MKFCLQYIYLLTIIQNQCFMSESGSNGRFKLQAVLQLRINYSALYLCWGIYCSILEFKWHCDKHVKEQESGRTLTNIHSTLRRHIRPTVANSGL
jgi:hypothetical protein